eukprot:12888490-Prorocentrum_lima.AAC.1
MLSLRHGSLQTSWVRSHQDPLTSITEAALQHALGNGLDAVAGHVASQAQVDSGIQAEVELKLSALRQIQLR